MGCRWEFTVSKGGDETGQAGVAVLRVLRWWGFDISWVVWEIGSEVVF